MIRNPARPLLARYRRSGADLPFADQARDHGASFEGYYWRFADRERGRVVIALCGLTAAASGRWAVAAMAAHPGGVVREAIVPAARGDGRGLGVHAGEVVVAGDRELSLKLGDAELRAEIADPLRYPRRALGSSGSAQLVPGLAQYWQPIYLGGRATVELRLGSEALTLSGASAYVEKNWGSSFPERWWWGQADDFSDDACVAFAGGPLRVAGAPLEATLLTMRLGRRFISLAPPLARTDASVDERSWRLRLRSPRYAVEIEGDDPAASAVVLPVPCPDRIATRPRSHQALAGRLQVAVRRGGRTLFRGESSLAGLERQRR